MSRKKFAFYPDAPAEADDYNPTYLRKWLRADHLKERAIASYRHAFTTHPSRLIVIQSFLKNRLACTLAHYFLQEANFETRYALYPTDHYEGPIARGKHTTQAEWQEADVAEHFFKFGSFGGFSTASKGECQYLNFVAAAASSSFRSYIELITGAQLGITLVETHRMMKGEFIRLHTDSRANRRIGIIIYLSPQWRSDFGGLYQIRDFSGRELTIFPEFNSLLIFDVDGHREHCVSEVQGDAVRISFNAWFLGANCIRSE